jgi:hypothetical protein
MTCRARLRRINIGVEVVITPPQSAILRSSHRRIEGIIRSFNSRCEVPSIPYAYFVSPYASGR